MNVHLDYQESPRRGSENENETVMLVVFIGPPGSGKGTQSKRLLEYLGLSHLSTGDMLRQAIQEGTDVGKMAKACIDNGQLVPDPIVISIVGKHLEQPESQGGCLFDGFPRTIGQAESLDDYLEHRGTPLTLVIELRVDPEELIRRTVERSKIENRSDDTPETIAQRMRVYQQQTKPLLDYYAKQGLLRSIDGMGTPDEVFLMIKACVDELKS